MKKRYFTLLLAFSFAGGLFSDTVQESATVEEPGIEEEEIDLRIETEVEPSQEEMMEDAIVSGEVEFRSDDERTFEDFMELFGNEPVLARESIRGRAPVEVALMEMDEIGLVVRGRDGSEITFPLADFNRNYQVRPDIDPSEIETMMQEGSVDEALEKIREELYPFLSFIELPEERVPSLHAGIVYLIEQLMRTGRFDEVVQVVELIPEPKLASERYGPTYRRVILRLIEQGEVELAMRLADRFDLRAERAAEVAPIVLEIADGFRINGHNAEASRFYQRIQRIEGIPEHREALLWNAYVLVEDGRMESARAELGSLDEMDRNDRLFALLRLVEGRMLVSEGAYRDALLRLSEAIVFGDLQQPWFAELLFTTAQCYARLDNGEVADELLRQIQFFYPDSPWAGRSLPGRGRG